MIRMDNVLLGIEGLSAWYFKGKPVIHNFDLRIGANEIIGLIGLNGAGKTTLLNTISGLHTGCSFTKMEWKGQPVVLWDNAFKRNRYLAFAEGAPFGYFTFDEYLSYVLSSYRKAPDRDRVEKLCEGFHFNSHRRTLIKDLSTGNRKKVFLMTGLALAPELLLLDEPVNGLDFESTEFLYEEIRGYHAYGTVLFSSHILESICNTSDLVIVLEDGHISHTFPKGQLDPETIRGVLRYEKDV